MSSNDLMAMPTYRAWINAKTRCYNPKAPNYKYYGGRGITMCEEWRNSFAAFLAHIGPRPSSDLSLDRIDTNGHYEPGNVRWATRVEQARGRRNYVGDPVERARRDRERVRRYRARKRQALEVDVPASGSSLLPELASA